MHIINMHVFMSVEFFNAFEIYNKRRSSIYTLWQFCFCYHLSVTSPCIDTVVLVHSFVMLYSTKEFLMS